ncbi:MAG: hypothetical protein RSH26_07380, partial [Clostridia bacterium]
KSKETAIGDIVTLTAVVNGAEGREISYQWECNLAGTWIVIPDATESTLRFALAEDTIGSEWRLRVTVL